MSYLYAYSCSCSKSTNNSITTFSGILESDKQISSKEDFIKVMDSIAEAIKEQRGAFVVTSITLLNPNGGES